MLWLDRELVGLEPRDLTAHCPVCVHLEEARWPDADKVRSEEATARRRERRHDLERMKLKRAAKCSARQFLLIRKPFFAQRYYSDRALLATVSRRADKEGAHIPRDVTLTRRDTEAPK